MSNLFVLPKQVPLNTAGNLLSGAKAYFYRTGTSTPKNTFSDAALTTPHANPVVADGAGAFPAIFLDTSAEEYRLTLNTSADVLIYTQDNVGQTNNLTQAIIGALLYPRTTAEIAAGVTPVNYTYVEGHIYRYQTNTTPGTTDMITGWNAMISLTGVVGILPAETVRINSNPNIPACVGIVGQDSTKSVISCGPSVTKAIRLTTASTIAGFTKLEDFRISGNSTAGAIGLLAGDGSLVNQVTVRNISVGGFTGVNGFGILVRDVVGVQFYNCDSFGNYYNWWFERSAVSSVPTTVDLYSCWSRLATKRNTTIVDGYLIRFYNPLFEGAEEDGLLVQPTASGNAVNIEIHSAWFEDNYGVDANEYHMTVDAGAAGSTAEVKVFGGLWNTAVTKSILLTGSGARVTVWSPGVPNAAGQIGTAAGAQLFVASWSQLSGDPDVTIDDTASACTWYSAGQMKMQLARTSTDPLCLDAYDEGAHGAGSSFTPAITLGGGSLTYTTQVGRYWVIGSLVIAEVKITVNVATTPSGTVMVTGLPVTSAANANGSFSVLATGLAATATTAIVGQVNAGATTASIFKYAAGAIANPGGDLANGCDIQFTAIYRAG